MTALNRRSFLSSLGVLGAGFALRGRFSTACPILTEVDVKPGEMINGFNHDLYRELKGEAGNVFYSPFSISTCLGMTAAGARKNTLAQMQNVLHLPSEAGAQDAAYAQLMAQMNSEKAGVTLSTANAIWAQKGYPWRPEFRDRVAKYGAGMKDADFATQFEAERKAINTWVEETTKSRIKDLLQAGDLDAMTRMVLVNAIYFKGSWADAFEAKATKDAPFTQLDGTK
jgi:serpin B